MICLDGQESAGRVDGLSPKAIVGDLGCHPIGVAGPGGDPFGTPRVEAA